MKGVDIHKPLMPRPRFSKRRKKLRAWTPILVSAFLIALALFSLPGVLAVDLAIEDAQLPEPDFPVTVYPEKEEIVVDPAVEELLSVAPSNLAAATGYLDLAYTWLAVRISQLSWYRQLAGAAGIDTLFVTVRPGYRAEEVAAAFGNQLNWSRTERAEFLEAVEATEPGLSDGQFAPGTYFVGVTTPEDVAALTQERFKEEVLARYSTTTQEVVPIENALTVASLIEREAGGWDDMRLISGIIWNRLFNNMNLQLDATLQYSKANKADGKGGWWPTPVPDDKFIRDPYNTYRNTGLPPGPIANPSVAAILAALNPKKTDCFYYFHDDYGRFHCSSTYKEHVALLKKFYGQGR